MKVTIELSDKEFEDFKELFEVLSFELREFRLQCETDYIKNSEQRLAEKQKRDEENQEWRQKMDESRATSQKILDEMQSRLSN